MIKHLTSKDFNKDNRYSIIILYYHDLIYLLYFYKLIKNNYSRK